MTVNPIDAILKKDGHRVAFERLVDMNGAELNTFLMGVMEQRTSVMTIASVLARYRQSTLVAPCNLDQRELLTADLLALNGLPEEFLVRELSPVSPMGSCSVIAGVSQKNILSSLRGVEVMADPASALALEAANLRAELLRQDSRHNGRVHLATCGRTLRLQNFDNIPGFVPHFRAFGLVSAGRDMGHEAFEISSLLLHLTGFLSFIYALRMTGGYAATEIEVKLSDMRILDAVIARNGLDRQAIGRNVQKPGFNVFTENQIELPSELRLTKELTVSQINEYDLKPPFRLLSVLERGVTELLKTLFPEVRLSIDLARAAGMGYYTSACFKIVAKNKDGKEFPLADGGFVPWSKQLLASEKERMLASGFGTELFCSNYKC
ncbi:MAG TPA: hypothetical protein VJA87_00345 [Candidatus Paceibacterota bacterium]